MPTENNLMWVHAAIMSLDIPGHWHASFKPSCHKLNVLISSDDGNFRIQFYFCGILQSCYLNFELSMNAIEELSSYRN